MSTGSFSVVDKRHCDQGWAWMVLLASFVANALIFGVVLSFGIYFVIFQEQFGHGKGATAWIGSIAAGTLLLVAPVASMLNEKFGCRVVIMAGGVISAIGFVSSAYAQDIYHLYFTYGVLTGVGFGLAYTPAVVAVGYYFDKRRELATALCVCGGGIGTLIFAPIYQYILDEYGWRGSLLINAGFSLHLCVCGALIRPYKLPTNIKQNIRPERHQSLISTKTNPSILDIESSSNDHKSSWVKRLIIKDYRLIVYMLNSFLWVVGCFVIFVLICDYTIHIGHTPQQAALLLSTFGVFNTVGRLAAGILCSIKSIDKLWLYNLSTIMLGLITLIYPGASTYFLMNLIQAAFGLFFGIMLGSLANVTVELFGIEKLAGSYGYVMFSHGAGCLVGPPLAGALYDSTKNYSTAFFFAGAIMLAGAMLFFILMYKEKKKYVDYMDSDDPIPVECQREKQSLIFIEAPSPDSGSAASMGVPLMDGAAAACGAGPSRRKSSVVSRQSIIVAAAAHLQQQQQQQQQRRQHRPSLPAASLFRCHSGGGSGVTSLASVAAMHTRPAAGASQRGMSLLLAPPIGRLGGRNRRLSLNPNMGLVGTSFV